MEENKTKSAKQIKKNERTKIKQNKTKNNSNCGNSNGGNSNGRINSSTNGGNTANDGDKNITSKTITNRNNIHHKKDISLFTRIFIRIIIVLILIVIFCTAGFFAIKQITKVNFESKYTLVDKQLSYCQELVSSKFKYSDILSLKKSSGLSKSYSIIKYTGIIRVGLRDFSQINVKISKDGKMVRIKIPQIEVLSNDVTNQEVFDEKQSIFVPITTQEIFTEMENAKNQMQEDMISEGILDEARDYTIKVIRQFMFSCGFENVEIE